MLPDNKDISRNRNIPAFPNRWINFASTNRLVKIGAGYELIVVEVVISYNMYIYYVIYKHIRLLSMNNVLINFETSSFVKIRTDLVLSKKKFVLIAKK